MEMELRSLIKQVAWINVWEDEYIVDLPSSGLVEDEQEKKLMDKRRERARIYVDLKTRTAEIAYYRDTEEMTRIEYTTKFERADFDELMEKIRKYYERAKSSKRAG